jgi:hypothetical protein
MDKIFTINIEDGRREEIKDPTVIKLKKGDNWMIRGSEILLKRVEEENEIPEVLEGDSFCGQMSIRGKVCAFVVYGDDLEKLKEIVVARIDNPLKEKGLIN